MENLVKRVYFHLLKPNMNKKITSLLVLGCLALTPASSFAQAKTQTARKLKVKTTKTVEIRYQLHLPKGYDAKAGKKDDKEMGWFSKKGDGGPPPEAQEVQELGSSLRIPLSRLQDFRARTFP